MSRTIVALSVCLFLVAWPAQAATTVVSYAWLVELILAFAVPVVSALGGWAVLAVIRKTGLDVDARHREAIEQALAKAVAYGATVVKSKAQGTVDVRNELIAEAARYAERSVPAAIGHFGLTPERLREMIVARLPA